MEVLDPDRIAIPGLAASLTTWQEFELDYSQVTLAPLPRLLLYSLHTRQVLTINPRSVLASLESIAECGVTTTDPPTLAGGGGGEQGADYPFSDSPGVFLDTAGKQSCRHTSSETSQSPSGSNTRPAAGAETVGKL